MIRRAPGTKNKFVVVSHDGKKTLSKPMSHAAAEKRLRQIEYFKFAGKKKGK